MIRAAGIKILNLQNKFPEWDLKMVMTVHDELVFTCREDYVEVASDKVCSVMESVAKFLVPISVEASIGDSYADAK